MLALEEVHIRIVYSLFHMRIRPAHQGAPAFVRHVYRLVAKDHPDGRGSVLAQVLFGLSR